MANYVIEGTVSKILVDESENFSFCITGLEGYCIKCGKTKYNVMIPENLKEVDEKDESDNPKQIHLPAIILSQDYQFSVSDKNKELVINNCSSNKRIKFTIKIDENGKLSKIFADKNKPIKISSLILFLE